MSSSNNVPNPPFSGTTAEEQMKSLVLSILSCEKDQDDEGNYQIVFTEKEFQAIKNIRQNEDW